MEVSTVSTNGVSATKRTREPSEMMSKAYEPSTVVIFVLHDLFRGRSGRKEKRRSVRGHFFSDFCGESLYGSSVTL